MRNIREKGSSVPAGRFHRTEKHEQRKLADCGMKMAPSKKHDAQKHRTVLCFLWRWTWKTREWSCAEVVGNFLRQVPLRQVLPPESPTGYTPRLLFRAYKTQPFSKSMLLNKFGDFSLPNKVLTTFYSHVILNHFTPPNLLVWVLIFTKDVFTWHSRKPNYCVSLTMMGFLRCMSTP